MTETGNSGQKFFAIFVFDHCFSAHLSWPESKLTQEMDGWIPKFFATTSAAAYSSQTAVLATVPIILPEKYCLLERTNGPMERGKVLKTSLMVEEGMNEVLGVRAHGFVLPSADGSSSLPSQFLLSVHQTVVLIPTKAPTTRHEEVLYRL